MTASALFHRQMIRRIQPEHQPPVESFWRIAGAVRDEGPPYIWDRCNDAVMNVGRSWCGIASLAEGADQFTGANKIHRGTIDRVKVKIFMDSPLRAKDEYAFSGLARHSLGVDDQTACLGDHRWAYSTEYIDTCMRVSVHSPCPRPVPETLMIVICRSAARHCLTLRDKIASNKDCGRNREECSKKFSLAFRLIALLADCQFFLSANNSPFVLFIISSSFLSKNSSILNTSSSISSHDNKSSILTLKTSLLNLYLIFVLL